MLDLTIKISEHVTLREVLHSPTADADGFTEQYNPEQKIIDNATALAHAVFEPLRTALCKEKGTDTPILVNSWFRCLRTNAAVGGVDKPGHVSQHVEGKAVDIHVNGMTIEELYQFIKWLARHDQTFKFDQLIQEFGSWVHISFNCDATAQRMMCLRATHGETGAIYTPENL